MIWNGSYTFFPSLSLSLSQSFLSLSKFFFSFNQLLSILCSLKVLFSSFFLHFFLLLSSFTSECPFHFSFLASNPNDGTCVSYFMDSNFLSFSFISSSSFRIFFILKKSSLKVHSHWFPNFRILSLLGNRILRTTKKEPKQGIKHGQY